MTDPATWFEAGWKLLPAWNAPPDPQAEARALDLIRRAAEAGHVPAMVALAQGLDPTDGFKWAIAAAQRGDLSALDGALSSGDWPVDGPLRVLAAARAGEAWAQVAVGRIYRLGMRDQDGVELATRDLAYGWLPSAIDPQAEGLRWLEAAAAGGWPPALLYLAFALERTAPERALALATRARAGREQLAARERDYLGQFHLQLLERVGASWSEQLAAHEAAAAEGNLTAHTWLADRHRLGDAVPVDLPRARALYEPAAAGGEVDACRELAKLLELGLGGPVDRVRAQELYERAAELGGDPYARQRLAEAFGLAWYATQG